MKYLYIGDVNIKEMAFKCNMNKYKIWQFNNITFTKQVMHVFFMKRLYPVSKDKF